MRILIATNAFKHSLRAQHAADAIARGIQQALPDARLRKLPIADGGNGTLDAWLSQGGERISVEVHDPLMRSITAEYGRLPDGKTVIIEMAQASGIEHLDDSEHNPMRATTYGTGELLQHALDNGARRFVIGMGGSATIDGGTGALQALGVEFLDSDGDPVPKGGGYLRHVREIDASGLDARWNQCEGILIASDVQNPLLGEEGAARVFGPQKGADSKQVEILEANLRHLYTLVAQRKMVDVRGVRGGGAAGGLAAGLMAFLGGEIRSGIEMLLEYQQVEKYLQITDLVITGEGQMDAQTVYGKGPMGIAQMAQRYGVPTVALVGSLDAPDSDLHAAGIHAVLPIVTQPMTLDDALTHADDLLERAALRLGYLLQLTKR